MFALYLVMGVGGGGVTNNVGPVVNLELKDGEIFKKCDRREIYTEYGT